MSITKLLDDIDNHCEQTESECESTEDQLKDLINLRNVLSKTMKEVLARANSAIAKELEHFPDGVTLGDIRYYLGVAWKHDRLRENHEILDFLYIHNTHAQNDDPKAAIIDPCDFLHANPWKTGALKKYLGAEAFAAMFRRYAEPSEKGGKPQRKVKSQNERFILG